MENYFQTLTDEESRDRAKLSLLKQILEQTHQLIKNAPWLGLGGPALANEMLYELDLAMKLREERKKS